MTWWNVPCRSAGVPPSQLARYGGLGRIDVQAVLEPLDFLLPPRDALEVPGIHVAAVEPSDPTAETQIQEPGTDPDPPAQSSSKDSGELEIQDQEGPE